MYATDYFETKALNTFNGVTATGASTLYVALFLSSPTDSGVSGNEVNYTGYTRLPVSFCTPYAESGGMGVKNTNDLLWEKAPSDIGQARYIGLYDSPTLGSGNMWLFGELSIPLDIKANQQPSIYAGDILYYLLGDFSTAFKTKVLSLLLGQNLPGFTPYLALFDGDPEAAGAELSGGAYARPAIAFTAPAQLPGGAAQISNPNDAKFPSPTSTWGLWAYNALMDAATGGGLVLKKVNPRPETLLKNYVPIAEAGGYKVAIN